MTTKVEKQEMAAAESKLAAAKQDVVAAETKYLAAETKYLAAKALNDPVLLESAQQGLESAQQGLKSAQQILSAWATAFSRALNPDVVVNHHKRTDSYGPENWADSEMVCEFFCQLKQQSATRPVDGLVDTYGKNFKIVDRQYAVDMLYDLCVRRLEAHNSGSHDAKRHPISSFLGGPGLGKSYLAQNLLGMLQLKSGASSSEQELSLLLQNATHAIGTFGNGTSLVDENIDVSTSLGLRWLHRECAIPEPFAQWLDRFSTTPKLRIEKTLSIFRQFRVRAGTLAEDARLLVLGVCDEVNRLISIDPTKFKELISGLGRACCSPPDNVFFVPWITGTDVTDVSNYFSKSMHPAQHVPVRLLESYSQVVDDLPGFQNWQTCEPFVRCLSDVGPHPRALEFFLEHVSEKRAVDLELIDYPELMLNVRNKLESRYKDPMTSQQRLHTVALAILDEPVDPNDLVPYSSGLSWQQLAERGTFVLDEAGRIRMPFIWFWLHASILARRPGCAVALSPWCDFFRPQASEEAGGLGFFWQSFESFLARVLALRVNMYKALGYEKVPLLRLLGGVDAVAMPSSLIDLQVSIPDAYIEYRILDSGRFPNSTALRDTNGKVIDWKGSCHSTKNMGGAPFDTFCSLFTPTLFLLLGQAKHAKRRTSNVVTSQVLLAEATKCEQAMRKLAIPWALFVCCTHAAKDLELPDQTIVTLHLDKFFGHTLASRGQLAAVGTKFKVNIAKNAELKMWEHIGSKLSGDIVTARNQRPFSDWDDLTSRVPKFPTWIKDFVVY